MADSYNTAFCTSYTTNLVQRCVETSRKRILSTFVLRTKRQTWPSRCHQRAERDERTNDRLSYRPACRYWFKLLRSSIIYSNAMKLKQSIKVMRNLFKIKLYRSYFEVRFSSRTTSRIGIIFAFLAITSGYTIFLTRVTGVLGLSNFVL